MKKTILITGMILSVLVITGCSIPFGKNNVGIEKAKEIVLSFVNDNFMQSGKKATVKEAQMEGNMYKVVILAENQEIITYLSKDGKKFFPSVIDIEESKKKSDDQKNKKETAEKEIVKNEKPEVELFVMSYCPYGTQIEKGIVPAVEVLKNKINFKLKFVDYLMHGEKEMMENLRQYCIQEKEPEKLFSYLKCFLASDKSDECLKSSGISSTLLADCVEETDIKYKIKENFGKVSQNPPFDIQKSDNEKYGVEGSPTLVINGVKVNSERDSASLLKSICLAFSQVPVECQKELSATPPAPGFGQGAGSNSSSSCGN